MRIEVPFQSANQLFIFSGVLLSCNLVADAEPVHVARALLSTALEDAGRAHRETRKPDESQDPALVSLNKFQTEHLMQAVKTALDLPQTSNFSWRDNALEICASFSQAEATYAM